MILNKKKKKREDATLFVFEENKKKLKKPYKFEMLIIKHTTKMCIKSANYFYKKNVLMGH